MSAPTDVQEFRRAVRAWLETVRKPDGLRDFGATPAAEDIPAAREWQRLLAECGYACIHWPSRHGGRDATSLEQAIFAEECARAGVPRQINIVGPDLVGPVIIQFGTDEQRERYLGPILRGDELWCQLFSEPEAGSDLASLRTRAVRQGDGWQVDGQKIWTSAADGSDLGLLIARTGGPGHRGLTAFVVDMTLPGIDIRPLAQMDGESKFNEVFLTSVRLPDSAMLGRLGGGWHVATATLGQERLSLGAGAVAMFDSLGEILLAARSRGALDDLMLDRLSRLWTRVWLLRTTWQRATAGNVDLASSTFSVLKLMSSEVRREIGDLGFEALGPEGLVDPFESQLVKGMLTGHAQTILGGTSEIQRNILAERVLGLPKEPRWQGAAAVAPEPSVQL